MTKPLFFCKFTTNRRNMRIAILGAGHIAGKMAATLAKMEGVELYAVAARELARAEAFAAEKGFAKAYGSYQEMVEDPLVELVYVATPHSHHYDHVKLCLEHGKAVLCEKSFTMNAAQARGLADLAREKNILLAEAIWTRYMPFSKTIAEVLDSGIIGTPQILSANLGYAVIWKERLARPELGGGALLDLGVYCLNFASMYFGDGWSSIQSVCTKTPEGVDLQETITLTYPDGRMANMHVSAAALTDRRGVIGGDKGYMVVDNINNPRHLDVFDRMQNLLGSYDAPECISGYEYEVYACMDAMRKGLCECPEMPLDETVRIMEVMDALRRQWGVAICV